MAYIPSTSHFSRVPTSWQFFLNEFNWVPASFSILHQPVSLWPSCQGVMSPCFRQKHHQTIDFTRILMFFFGSKKWISPFFSAEKRCRCLRLAAVGPSGGGGGGPLEGAAQPGAGQRRPVGISVRSNQQDEWIFFNGKNMEKNGKIWMNLNLVKF